MQQWRYPLGGYGSAALSREDPGLRASTEVNRNLRLAAGASPRFFIAPAKQSEFPYLSFTVASAIAASIAPISQNRTTTCDSVHPFFWKW